MPLRHLFIDMNAFFASCEQQDKPHLRGLPVAVIPTDAETTACIAASYEAKAFGVKTGTPVWEARKLCRGIHCVVADHRRYVVMHNRVVDAVRSVLEVDRIMSIDEMSCRLNGDERNPDSAAALAGKIKTSVYERAGDQMHCSIGVGPNTMLAKVAADMRKPNGLTLLPDADMPGRLYGLSLRDFPGIGPRMERRLNLYGVFAVSQLCEMPLKSLCEVWGSQVLGGRWHRYLHGEDVVEPKGRRQSVSHSHVLPPDLRTDAGAYGILVRLTHKAAARLRKIGYWAGGVSVGLSFKGEDATRTGAGEGFEDFDDEVAPTPHPPHRRAVRRPPPQGGRSEGAALTSPLEGEVASGSARSGWGVATSPPVSPAPAKQSGGWGRDDWHAGCRVPHCQDTPTILHAIAKLWALRPKDRVPFKVGMVLADLKPARCATPSLFEEDRKAAAVSKAMDEVNAEFGSSAVDLGTMHGYEAEAPNRIAFTQIPDFDRRVS